MQQNASLLEVIFIMCLLESVTCVEHLRQTHHSETHKLETEQKSTRTSASQKDTPSLSSLKHKDIPLSEIKNDLSPTKKQDSLFNKDPAVAEPESVVKNTDLDSRSNSDASVQRSSQIDSSDQSKLASAVHPTESPLPPSPTENTTPQGSSILFVSLGSGEDEIIVSQMSWLFYRHERQMTVILYGQGPREASFPKGVKIINIPVDEADPLRPQGSSIVGLTPEDASRGEWVSGRILWSRIAACRGLGDVETTVRAARPSVIVSPLFLHDVCVLALAHRLDIPVVGVLTSRVGAWWAWAQLGVLPPLSTVAVPLTSLREGSLWDRAANQAHHYNYMSSLRQQWQAKAMTALPASWDVPSLPDLYTSVSRLLYTWDPLLDPFGVPVPAAIPIGGFASTFRGEAVEDILESAVLNRQGIIIVIPGNLESWIGRESIEILRQILEKTSFTVIWKVTHPHLRPNTTTPLDPTSSSQSSDSKGRFIFAQQIPLSDLLNHPRHRLLVSTCGESDVMAAVHFGSPLMCLPVTTDQQLAATQVVNLGMGFMLLASEMNLPEAEERLQLLTTERRYRLRARDLAEDLHDQPLTPSERLLFHVENVVRRPQSIRHKISGSSLPLIQYTNADVFLVVIVCLTLLLVVAIHVFVKLYPFISKSLKLKKD